MRIRQITVALGRTVNLGSFNSARIEMSEVIDIEADDDVDREKRRAMTRLKKAIGAELDKLVPDERQK